MPVMTLIMSTALCSMPAWACDAQARTGLDARLLQAVCLVESRGNHQALNPMDGHSPSYGACQIKLGTAKMLGFKGTADDLMHPSNNYYWAARYLSKHLKLYNNVDMAISAYNAGRPISGNSAYVGRVKANYHALVKGERHDN